MSFTQLVLWNADLVHLLGTYMEDADRENYIIAISTIIPPTITRDEGKRLLDTASEMCDDCGKKKATCNFGDGFICSQCNCWYMYIRRVFTMYHREANASCTDDEWYIVCRMTRWTGIGLFAMFFTVRDMLLIFENLSVKSRPALRYRLAIRKLETHREFERDGVFSPNVDVSTLTPDRQKARKTYLAFIDHDIDGISAGTSFLDLTYHQITQLLKYKNAQPGEISTNRGFKVNLRIHFGPDVEDSFFYAPHHWTCDIDYTVFVQMVWMLRRSRANYTPHVGFPLFVSWFLSGQSTRMIESWVRHWVNRLLDLPASRQPGRPYVVVNRGTYPVIEVEVDLEEAIIPSSEYRLL